ncbi:S9 family peptidase [Candidatus Bipolaricaulota bacterium]|nr:S9 family peptidase [Candidatus Bipolaricaulota bacterium]
MNSFKKAASQPPVTRRTDHVDRLHEVDVPDPYRWLEDVDSPDIKTWICAQNEHTQSVLANVSFGKKLRERVGALSSYEIVGMPKGAGNRLFFTLQMPEAKQPSLVWTELGGDEIHCLLDPETLATDATVSIEGFDPSPSGRYLAYGLSAAGSDWQKWYIMDVDTGRRLEDELHWIRFTFASWREDESGFFYSGSEPPPPEEVYKAPVTKRSIRFHHLGEAQANDAIVYDRQDEPEWMSFGRVTLDDRYLVITIQKGTHRRNRVCVLDLTNPDDAPLELVPEFESAFTYLGKDGDRLFFWTNNDAPFGRIVAIDLSAPDRESWQEVVAESDGVITMAAYIHGCFVVAALVDAESRVLVYDSAGTIDHEIKLPGRGTVPWVEGRSDGSDVYLWYHDVFRPTFILRHELILKQTTPFREQELPYDPASFVTERYVCESADGTKVPLFVSRKKSTEVGPETPTCLYGYGGFNIPLSPSFRLDHLAWMDMGGQLVVACIRGGGEYGYEWHQAGACENRPNVFDDFIAAAEWLIKTNRTSTPKLVIHGRSNGGLLVGACMTKRPDLYGACLPAVGVLDMLRFHQFTVGSFWVSDYGSPADADMFPLLMSYSPLHNVNEGTAYPPTLVTTADHDDRVFPAHSFKFAATLQHAQTGDNPILLRIEERAGHGMGKPKGKLLDEIADNWIFALAALGAEPEFD